MQGQQNYRSCGGEKGVPGIVMGPNTNAGNHSNDILDSVEGIPRPNLSSVGIIINVSCPGSGKLWNR